MRTHDLTTVVVLHDLNLAARYCDQLVLDDGGAGARSGSPDVVLQEDLLERVNGVGVRRRREDGCLQLIFRPLQDAVGSASVSGSSGVGASGRA
ncbi:MAG TPA: hypothetical protein VGO80_08070 [Solirubrobacteraceae bacterium]|nr:hypothetical protein [Solirubrobacteraceae bacterium]